MAVSAKLGCTAMSTANPNAEDVVGEFSPDGAERAQATLESIGDAVACTDRAGNLTFLNAVAERMTGWSWAEAAGRPMDEVFRILDASTRAVIPNPMEIAAGQDQTVHLRLNAVLLRRDGSEVPIEDSAAPIRGRDGQADGAVIVFRDVTAARAKEREIAHLARHDFLTGLPNRMLLEDRIVQALALARRRDGQIAILFLDLDDFKRVNDSLGHAVGDRLLQSVASRLLECVRASDTVSRQGGDEFVMLLADVDGRHASMTAERMLKAISEPHQIDGQLVRVSASIGVSTSPEGGTDARALIHNADASMYRAKHEGGGRVREHAAARAAAQTFGRS